jgi:phosphoglucosamine mutase
VEHHANLGIAFDGDGDRVLLVSPTGGTIDGDRMMGIAALHLQQKGSLDPAIVVATVMSNLGLEEVLKGAGIELVRTPVGDRNVAQAMLAHGAKIGGEQSGHIIFSDHSTTGDGILTAVKLLEIAHERGIDLHTLAEEIPLYPQVQHDIAASDPNACLNLAAVQEAIAAAEDHLVDCGRLIVRASGTQPLVRVLVEGKDEALCHEVCTRLATVIEKAWQKRGAERA